MRIRPDQGVPRPLKTKRKLQGKQGNDSGNSACVFTVSGPGCRMAEVEIHNPDRCLQTRYPMPAGCPTGLSGHPIR